MSLKRESMFLRLLAKLATLFVEEKDGAVERRRE